MTNAPVMAQITDWVNGTYDEYGTPYHRTDRIRTVGSIDLTGVRAIKIAFAATSDATLKCCYCGYDADGDFVENLNWYYDGAVIPIASTVSSGRFALGYENNGTISPTRLSFFSWKRNLWELSAGVNDGYPLCLDNMQLPMAQMTAPYPLRFLRVDGTTNDGYPYLWWMTADAPAGDSGVNRLYHGSQQPAALYYGALAVQACYCNGQQVYRPAAE